MLLAIAIVATVAAIGVLNLAVAAGHVPFEAVSIVAVAVGQISIGFGTSALYLMNCCTWTIPVGIISLVVGIALLIWWWVAYKRTICGVVMELAPVLSAVIALMGYVALVALICLNTIVGGVVGTISAVLSSLWQSCLGSGDQAVRGLTRRSNASRPRWT